MTRIANYPGTCNTCKVAFPAGTTIFWAPGLTTHATVADCDAAKAANTARLVAFNRERPEPVAAPVLDMKPVADFLARATGKLKFPKVLFLAPGGGELKLYIAGTRSTFPGSVVVVVNGEWLGRITPEGEAHGRALTGNAALVAALNTLALDPAKAAKEYAALRGCCSFCSKGLTDDGSIEVGYGPRCAKNYNLPWKAKGTKVIAAAPVATPSLMSLVAQLEGGAL